MIDINRHSLSEKQNNVIKVLGAIIDKPEAQTSDIQRETGLSVSTISRVVLLLRQKNLLVITGKEKTAKGRYPLVMKFNFDYGHIVHIDLTPECVSGCAANLSGTIIKTEQIAFNDSVLTLEYILASVKELFGSLAEGRTTVLAAGISLPGIVRERMLSRIPDLSALNGTDIYTLIEETLHVPVIINNVPGVAAVGELISSYPKSSSLVYLNIMQNIGIGAGIVIGGRLIKGKDGIAGEVGDFFFDRKSFSGETSKSVGRLEEYAGLSALYERAQQLIKSGGAVKLKDIMQKEAQKKPSLSLIERSISEGDKDLEETYLEVIKVWVILIIDFVLMLNPEIIVVGGAVREENKLTQKVINEMLRKELFVKQEVELSRKGTVFAGGLHMLKSHVFSNIIARKATQDS